MNEIWQDIAGYEGYYQVSNLGRVKSVSRKVSNGHSMVNKEERILLPNTLAKGYYQVTLYNGKTRKCFQVHRLVAMVFIPNPKSLPQVNHKDGNKQNNIADNLEWCDNSGNQLHAWRIGLQKPHYCGGGAPKKRVALLNDDGGIDSVFESIGAVSRYLGANRANCSKVASGNKRQKTIYGRKLKFV